MSDGITFDREAATARVVEMMAIPGKSGNEAAILAYIKETLRAAGLPDGVVRHDDAHTRSPIGGEVGNLIVTLPGTIDGPRRLLMAHVDTVPLCVGCEPVIEGDRVVSANKATALGGDDRAGAAVVLTALLEILAHNLPHPPLTALFAIQEEIGLVGARCVSKESLGDPELCFNFDGGDPSQAIIGATGDIAMTIEVHGVASHAGASPEAGVSAAAIAGLAIADLVNNGWHGKIEKEGRSGTSNIGVLSGGDATNVVLPHLHLRAEARSHDADFRQEIVAAFRTAFESAAAQITNVNGVSGRVEMTDHLKYEAFRLDEDEAVVQAGLAAVSATGMQPSTRISNGGLDANWMAAHGFPTVTFGCGQAGIHTVNETLNLPEFHAACEIGLRLATAADSNG